MTWLSKQLTSITKQASCLLLVNHGCSKVTQHTCNTLPLTPHNPCISKLSIPQTDQHGLGLHHVRAVGSHILAKVRETGFRTEPNGQCFMASVTEQPVNPLTHACPTGDSTPNDGTPSIATTLSPLRSRSRETESQQRCRSRW